LQVNARKRKKASEKMYYWQQHNEKLYDILIIKDNKNVF